MLFCGKIQKIRENHQLARLELVELVTLCSPTHHRIKMVNLNTLRTIGDVYRLGQDAILNLGRLKNTFLFEANMDHPFKTE